VNTWPFILAILLTSASGYASEFKIFDKEGKALYQQGSFQDALAQFKQAYLLEKEAQKYRDKDRWPETYMPRFSIARCYWQLGDLMQAEQWITDAEKAMESNILKAKSDRDLMLEYNQTRETILTGAKTFREKIAAERSSLKNRFDRALSQNQFAQARTFLKDLQTQFPNSSEAVEANAQLTQGEKAFFNLTEAQFETALVTQNWTQAQEYIHSLEQVNRGDYDLSPFTQKLRDAQERAAAASSPVTVAQTQEPPKKTLADLQPETPPQSKVASTPSPKTQSVDSALTQKEATPTTTAPETATLDAALRKNYRTSLLGILNRFRQTGDVDGALAALTSSPAFEQTPSFFWIRAYFSALKMELSSSASDEENIKNDLSQVFLAGVQPDQPWESLPTTMKRIWQEISETRDPDAPR
jgi:tetratricopeptide (TPR) repeat protein